MNGLKKETNCFIFFLVNSVIVWIIGVEDILLLIGLSLLSVVLLSIRTMVLFVLCHLTARSLHNQMFNALLRAPVLFFDSNPLGKRKSRLNAQDCNWMSGRVINRFSKDVSSIDQQVVDVVYDCVNV